MTQGSTLTPASGDGPGWRRISVAAAAALAPADRLAALASSELGLSADEAAARLALAGPNAPVRPQKTRALFVFVGNFTHTLALLLWFAAGLAFASGAPELGGAIVAVVVINGVFAFVQEHRAEQVVASLMRSVAVQAHVVRDGEARRVPAEDVVPGDVVRLDAGDIVPADAALFTSDNLTLDLSMLTGESASVAREAGWTLSPNAGPVHVADLENVTPAGSAVVTGSGIAVVCVTGPESTLGQVAELVENVQRGESALERQIATLARVTAAVAVFAGLVTLVLASATGGTAFLTALTFATGVIVALVPEGLLPTLSVSLAIGARRMALRGAAVRRLSAVEIVGSVTVICTDKTGTLTMNSLSVLGFVPASGPDDEAMAPLAAALCNNAQEAGTAFEGDPLDVALATWALGQGVDLAAAQRDHARLSDVPFDAHRRYMSVTCEVAGLRQTFTKGAPEAVLALAAPPSAAVEAALAHAAEGSERVLLLAQGAEGTQPRVIGLWRLYDPPRRGVPEAIRACRDAGVRVVMLTGDHPATARAVAREIGMDAAIAVIEGPALDSMSDGALLEALSGDAVFARIDPEQKLRIVKLLRRAGEIVVVTGDGINDAPALRAADVGVAMGRRGTEVAKQAADIILADDNFATIVAAIEEGRSIKANIRRFVSYVFTSNVAELMPFLVYVFFPVPLPLAVIQVLAIDLGTDLLPALGLGAEAPSAGAMAASPEPPSRPLLTRSLAVKTFLFFGLLEGLLGLAAFFGYHWAAGWRPFDSLLGRSSTFDHEAATLTFLGIVAGQLGLRVRMPRRLDQGAALVAVQPLADGGRGRGAGPRRRAGLRAGVERAVLDAARQCRVAAGRAGGGGGVPGGRRRAAHVREDVVVEAGEAQDPGVVTLRRHAGGAQRVLGMETGG